MKHNHPILSLPTSPEAAAAMAGRLIAHHRGTFGDARMEDDPDPAGPPADDPPGGDPQVNEHGFPDKTPVADMTTEQQTAYWKHQARKHESTSKSRADYDAIKAERDQLKKAGMSPDEQAIQDAKDQAAAEARTDERGKWAGRTVKAELRAALKGKVHIPKGRDEGAILSSILDPLNPQHFLTSDGEVDADKVTAYASGFGGAATPDMGQGKRGDNGKKSLASATEDARARREKKTN